MSSAFAALSVQLLNTLSSYTRNRYTPPTFGFGYIPISATLNKNNQPFSMEITCT